MHICLLSTQIFRWGNYGGFGRATRMIGRAHARRGVQVSAIVPLRAGAREPVRETFDGITVYGYPPGRLRTAERLCREVDADLYHTQQPFIGSWLAQRARPCKAHVVTFRVPSLPDDWMVAFRHAQSSPLRVTRSLLYNDNPLTGLAVRRADGWGIAGEFLREAVRRKYGPGVAPVFLPTPVDIPARVEKSRVPTVCFVGRFDRIKRPDRFFRLAARHPEIKFIAVGKASCEPYWESIRPAGAWPDNLRLEGFVDQFESTRLSEILARSWVLVNTSEKEGLANVFLEAAAHGCAVLSPNDTDGFASRFGYHVTDGDYSAGLEWLLEEDRWRERGEAGRAHVRQHFATDVAIDRHLSFYDEVLARDRPRRAGMAPWALRSSCPPASPPPSVPSGGRPQPKRRSEGGRRSTGLRPLGFSHCRAAHGGVDSPKIMEDRRDHELS